MTERIQDVAHLGRIELLTPKLDRSRWHFETLLGMEVAHAAGKSLYLRGYGDYAASTLKLTESDEPGIGAISWRTASPEALERRVKAVQGAGLGERWDEGEFGRGPAYPISRSGRLPHGALLRGAEIPRARSSALDAEEPADEVHRPRGQRPAHRPPRAARPQRAREP